MSSHGYAINKATSENCYAIFLAERMGFEPTVLLPVHVLSRHAP